MQIRQIGPEDLDMLIGLTPGLFDAAIRPDQAQAFLAVGMARATVLLHPDKAPAAFVNEVSPWDEFLRRGIATALMQHLIGLSRARDCEGVWLGTEPDNKAALGLYRKLGGDEAGFKGFGWDDAL
jgi:ribosomal protein S18 acetylase RimI-like enzyme